MKTDRAGSARVPLDALNFFLADVRDGLGPYLAIYLLTVQKWDEASIGFTLSAAGIAGIIAQTPAGALIDATRAKLAILIAAALAITISSLAIPVFPSLAPVAILQALSGVAGAVFPPAIAAVTLGIVGPKAFARRIGRTEAFNHAGNATAALLAGGFAYGFGPIAVFWLMAAMALASIVATLSVPADAIDHDVARGLHGPTQDEAAKPSGLNVLLANPPLLVFAISTTLFHFANAAMLPLVGQKLALANPELATTLMSACIVAAQLVMVPIALIVGAKADAWGRKPIFAVALAVLCIRGLLYPLSDDPYWLVGVQLLDGIGGRHLRRAVSADRRRSDSRHRPFQRQPGRDCDRPGHRRGAEHVGRRRDRRRRRIQRGLPVPRRGRRHWTDRAAGLHVGTGEGRRPTAQPRR